MMTHEGGLQLGPQSMAGVGICLLLLSIGARFGAQTESASCAPTYAYLYVPQSEVSKGQTAP